MPKISVVMPVYNAEKYLREAIDSILSQTYTDFEFIIIDDGSTDSSPEIVRTYDDARIRFFQNEHNMGVAATLNRGLDLATGEYIARMDSDDISLPERFVKQMEYMDKHPECAVVGTDMEIFGAKRYQFIHSTAPEQLKVDLLFASALGHPTVMMRSSVVGKDGLHYDNSYNGIEDYELWVRVAAQHELGNLDSILLRYRMHSSQVTKNRADDYLEKHRRLKERQMSALNLPTDGHRFAAFVQYCVEGQVESVQEKRALISYLRKIAAENTKRKIYDPTLLKTAIMIRACRVIAVLQSSDRRLVLKENHISYMTYGYYRLKSMVRSRMKRQ